MRKKRVGLVLVHGIGGQARGSMLDEFTATVLAPVAGAATHCHFAAGIPELVVPLEDREVRVYEAHWAHILSGARVTLRLPRREPGNRSGTPPSGKLV